MIEKSIEIGEGLEAVVGAGFSTPPILVTPDVFLVTMRRRVHVARKFLEPSFFTRLDCDVRQECGHMLPRSSP